MWFPHVHIAWYIYFVGRDWLVWNAAKRKLLNDWFDMFLVIADLKTIDICWCALLFSDVEIKWSSAWACVTKILLPYMELTLFHWCRGVKWKMVRSLCMVAFDAKGGDCWHYCFRGCSGFMLELMSTMLHWCHPSLVIQSCWFWWISGLIDVLHSCCYKIL